jgi:biotin synthase-related radical SAM superfamily protein
MRLSLGSAVVLGLSDAAVDVLPTTCYILVGDKCPNNCSFCTQAKDSTADADKLSRVTWPEFDDNLVYDRLIDAYTSGKIWRACIQATDGSFGKCLEIIHNINIPICISINANEEQISQLIEAGAETVTLALDAATEKVFSRIKTGNFNEILTTLKNSSKKHPGKIGTHLIVGLGETKEEIIETIKYMYDNGINVGLFAFTPVKGTKMENQKQPDIKTYRKIQAEHFKIRFKTDKVEPEAFETTGCPGCNRPFYNESPGGIIYNYPRRLTDEEYRECLEQLN